MCQSVTFIGIGLSKSCKTGQLCVNAALKERPELTFCVAALPISRDKRSDMDWMFPRVSVTTLWLRRERNEPWLDVSSSEWDVVEDFCKWAEASDDKPKHGLQSHSYSEGAHAAMWVWRHRTGSATGKKDVWLIVYGRKMWVWLNCGLPVEGGSVGRRLVQVNHHSTSGSAC